MKKGIVAGSIGREASFEETLKEYKKFGFEGIEIIIGEEGGWFNLSSTKAEIKALKATADKVGIEIHSIMAGLLWKYSLSSPDNKLRDKGMSIVEKCLNSAPLLGATAVLVVPGVVNDEVSYEYAYPRSQAALKELVSTAEKTTIYMAIENVWNKFLLSPLEMNNFIDGLKSDYAKAYFDVGNIILYGYPEQWIKTLGKRIVKIHLKDFKVGYGFTFLLEGDVNWPKVRNAIEEIGYNDYLTAELGLYRFFPDEMLQNTSRSIDRIIAGK